MYSYIKPNLGFKALVTWFLTLLFGSVFQSLYLFIAGDLQTLGIVPLMFVFGLPITSPTVLALWFLLDTVLQISDIPKERAVLLFISLLLVNAGVLWFCSTAFQSMKIFNANVLHVLGGYSLASFVVTFFVCRRFISKFPDHEKFTYLKESKLENHIGKPSNF